MERIFCDCTQLRELARELPSEPRNHGLTWLTAGKNALAEDFRALHNLRILCIKYGRTPDAIVAKLRDMNLLRYSIEDSTYRYNTPEQQTPTQPEIKLEHTMTQPLQTLTLIFGNDIKECSPEKLITAITKCQTELASLNNIPRNKWTDKRGEELKAAIAAAVDELNTRA